MSEDFIGELSRSNHEHRTRPASDPVLFPEIPDPPPGFNPEANPIFSAHTPHSMKALGKSAKKTTLIPRARVFILGPEGCPEYEGILARGVEGSIVLGKKEVTDMRGSTNYKVYLEWMEIAKK
jgi:hypothetical protein